jgi:hypothetical protein
MVVKRHILQTIQQLDRLYNSAATTEATYYSKLAIIELCGWIEYSMDNIAQNFADRHLKTHPFQQSFAALKRANYGFEYKKNFRKMLSQTIGLHNMEKIEGSVNTSGAIEILDATLDALKLLRDDAAHNFIGSTTRYQAPSVTKSQLIIVYPILKEIGRQVRTL